jgi:hypothetical protein
MVPIQQIPLNTPHKPADVELFDPPMCCPTGLCGPTLDQTLIDVNEMILALTTDGISITRYQMASQPQAFLQNPEVVSLIREREMAALPITVVKGKVIKFGEYPTLLEIRAALEE